jgi:hypothetical protein
LNQATSASKSSISRSVDAGSELVGGEPAVLPRLELGSLFGSQCRDLGHGFGARRRSNQRMSSASHGRAPNFFVRETERDEGAPPDQERTSSAVRDRAKESDLVERARLHADSILREMPAVTNG